MRLIDADALIVTDDDCGKITCRECKNHITNCEELEDLIRNAPTIEPQRTGEWIYDAEAYPLGNPYGHYDCDQCGESVPHKTNFCPNCGADMRTKGDDNHDI